MRAGVIATVLFLAVYSMLAHIDPQPARLFPGPTQRRGHADQPGGRYFQHWGTVILAAIFFIAYRITPAWAGSAPARLISTPCPQGTGSGLMAFFTLLSMVISNASAPDPNDLW